MTTESRRLSNIAKSEAYMSSPAYQYDLAEEAGYSRDKAGVQQMRAEQAEDDARHDARNKAVHAAAERMDALERHAARILEKMGVPGRVSLRGNYRQPGVSYPVKAFKTCLPLPERMGVAKNAMVLLLQDGRYLYGDDYCGTEYAADITARVGK